MKAFCFQMNEVSKATMATVNNLGQLFQLDPQSFTKIRSAKQFQRQAKRRHVQPVSFALLHEQSQA